MYHSKTIPEIKKELHTDISKGLSTKEADERLWKFGSNAFTEDDSGGIFHIIFTQFKSPLVWVLLVAGIATIFLHEYLDAIVIGIALFINIIIGTVQEKRAESAFEKLKKSQEKFATVLRDGKQLLIESEKLVPGDIIFVKPGAFIPADARVIESQSFMVNESALTGEWVEVEKNEKKIEENARITDMENMIWMGTLATSGFVKAVVVATGDDTQVGSIAKNLTGKESDTPLQKGIKRLALILTLVIFVILALILAIGLLRGESLQEMLLVAIAIAVAAMPEGLPAAVTVVLALGMEQILKKKGLVRNLLAAETLGSTTVILTDKTGTLTKAKMRVAEILSISSFENPDRKSKNDDSLVRDSDERDILAMALMTSSAFVEGYDDALAEWVVRGNPVERAVMLAGLESGINKDLLLSERPQFDVIPFESARRMTASLNYISAKKKRMLYVTGAPELILGHATHAYKHGKKIKLSKKILEDLKRLQEEKSSQGMRIVAVAYKEVDYDKFSKDIHDDSEKLLEYIVFGGFVIIHDPLRPDAAESIKKAKEAGTRVIMLTGDNVHTARRIAIEAGISSVSGKALTGKDIENYSDEELLDALRRVKIFARVLPNQKMRIVNILKKSGEVVAMTGDGINDAPALRRADIGVALGSGTEVAKEASDIVLLNNSFTVIVKAIEEGRRILDNLKKIIAYLLSTSFTEIFVVGGALIAGVPLPILPAQILWTNIVEEGFMNFSFAFEPKEKDVMKRNPSSAKIKNLLSRQLRSLILILGLVTGILMTAIYFMLLKMNIEIEEVRTIMFMVLSVDSIFFALSLKNLHKPLWKINVFSNKYLIFALFMSFGALLLAIFTPALQTLLSIQPVSTFDLIFILIVGIINLIIIEIVKYIYFRKKR